MKKTIQRHEPTAEERAEAARLRSIWEAYKRANPGVSQEWLGAQAKIGGQSAVSQYLRGDLALNFATLVRFCGVLHAAPADISPRLVEQHITDPSLDGDLFARTTRAAGRLTDETSDSPNRGQKMPLSAAARELIGAITKLDRASADVETAFRLTTGLLLLSARRGHDQDAKSTEELLNQGRKIAGEILGDKPRTRVKNASARRKGR